MHLQLCLLRFFSAELSFWSVLDELASGNFDDRQYQQVDADISFIHVVQ